MLLFCCLFAYFLFAHFDIDASVRAEFVECEVRAELKQRRFSLCRLVLLRQTVPLSVRAPGSESGRAVRYGASPVSGAFFLPGTD